MKHILLIEHVIGIRAQIASKVKAVTRSEVYPRNPTRYLYHVLEFSHAEFGGSEREFRDDSTAMGISNAISNVLDAKYFQIPQTMYDPKRKVWKVYVRAPLPGNLNKDEKREFSLIKDLMKSRKNCKVSRDAKIGNISPLSCFEKYTHESTDLAKEGQSWFVTHVIDMSKKDTSELSGIGAEETLRKRLLSKLQLAAPEEEHKLNVTEEGNQYRIVIKTKISESRHAHLLSLHNGMLAAENEVKANVLHLNEKLRKIAQS